MPNAYCFFSFKDDGPCLEQAIRSIRAADPTGRIAVFDDGHVSLTTPPDCDHYERTWFERWNNLNGRECIMAELLAFQKAGRLFNAEYVAKVDCDTIIVNADKAFTLIAEERCDIYGSSWHDYGVWGPFYILRTAFIPRMLDAVNSFEGLHPEEDMGVTSLVREARGKVSIVNFKDKRLRFLNGLDFRMQDFDLHQFADRCAVTCGNRMQIEGPNPRLVSARAMSALLDLLHHDVPFPWADVLLDHVVINAEGEDHAKKPGSRRVVDAVVQSEHPVEAVAEPQYPIPEVPADLGEPDIVEPAEPHESVAVIVIGYNDAEHLPECLDSIMAQSATLDEIVYVDDGGTDGSMDIAARYPAIKARRLEKNLGMCGARMEGLGMTTSALVLFVDSDNVLPSTYLQTMLEDLSDDVDLVYPHKHYIGSNIVLDRNRRWHPNDQWTPCEPNRAKLWRENHVDTCSLMRREALLAAGGWRDNPAHTMADWDLALRMTRHGNYSRSRARLKYRLHDQNWSARIQSRADRPVLYGLVRRHAASITVATIWSGRMEKLKKTWLSALCDSLMAAGKTADLLILDDSPGGFTRPRLTKAQNTVLSGISVKRVHRGIDTAQRRPDRRATAEFLCAQCNDVLTSAQGDVIWFVEDDIVVPANAADELLRQLLQTPDAPRTAAGGCYLSRHTPDHWIAANVINNKVIHLKELPDQPTPVQFTGTGCLMVLKNFLGDVRFGVEWNHGTLRSTGHDWVFCWRLYERDTPVVLVPSVVCRHHKTATEWF